MTRYKSAGILIPFILAGTLFAQQLEHSKRFSKDHSSDYQVGTLQTTEVASTGTFTSCDHGCISQSTGHNVHYLETESGLFVIDSPTSTAGSIFQSALVGANAPDVHIQWFMDELHPGDKVLFAAACGKHNDCTFWLPKPDKPGKEYITAGSFHPRVAKTNTTQLCGTGKLSPSVEAQVCQQATAQGTPAVTSGLPTSPGK